MFHAVVCIKQVPDSSNIRIDPVSGNLIRTGVPTILNPYDAHAVASAVAWKRKLGGKVTILSMGPSAAMAAIRECIEMGADRGILVSDKIFAGADTYATSYVLSGAIAQINSEERVDAIFCGKQAIDGDTAQVGPGIATRMMIPLVTCVSRISEIDPVSRTALFERRTERSIELIRTGMPFLATCEKSIEKISVAPLPDLIRSLRFECENWTGSSPVKYDPAQCGTKGSPTIVLKTWTPERVEPGETINVDQEGLETAVAKVFARVRDSNVVDLLKGVTA